MFWLSDCSVWLCRLSSASFHMSEDIDQSAKDEPKRITRASLENQKSSKILELPPVISDSVSSSSSKDEEEKDSQVNERMYSESNEYHIKSRLWPLIHNLGKKGNGRD